MMSSNYAAYEGIFLAYGERKIVFARPASIADLKERIRSHFGLKCDEHTMRIGCSMEPHGLVELADDASVTGLETGSMLHLAIEPLTRTPPQVILEYGQLSTVVEAPSSIEDCLVIGKQHFGISADRVVWQNDGESCQIVHDAFFATVRDLWRVELIVSGPASDVGKADESLVEPKAMDAAMEESKMERLRNEWQQERMEHDAAFRKRHQLAAKIECKMVLGEGGR